MSATLRRKQFAFEVKEVGADGTFAGYGSVFGVKDQQGDIVVPGAFDRTLKEWGTKGALPPMLWQHDQHEPIGGYTQMTPDEKGLFVKGKILLNAGPTEVRAYEHLKAGSVRGLSIGYSMFAGGTEYDKANDAYMLKAINLWELSVVTFPANPEALVDSVKSILETGAPKEFERFLRDAGLSREQAKGLMARGYEALRLRDAGHEENFETVVKQMQSNLTTLRALRGIKEK